MFEKIKNILHNKVVIYKNRKIENENILSNKETYNSLVPKVDDEVDKNGTYCNMLLWSLGQEKIKNIALTGIYGAGKSSIIEKLVVKNKNRYNFFQISLASFTGNMMLE